MSAPTAVLQCDWNQQPSHGFGIGCYGGVSYRDQSSFYACRTGDGDEVNIYLEPNGGGCDEVVLHADSCRPPCAGGSFSSHPSADITTPGPNLTPAPIQASTSTTAQSHSHTVTSSPTTSPSAEPASASSPGQCDAVVAQGPDDIIMIDRANPDISFGPNPDMLVQLSPNISAIFVFRLATTDAGKMCAVAFDLPEILTRTSTSTSASTQTQQQKQTQQDLENPPYRLTGSGPARFLLLDGPPSDPDKTSYSNAPRVAMPLEAVLLAPGTSIQPLAFPCPGADSWVAVEIRDEPGSDACLEYEQRQPRELVGMYLLKC